MKRKVLDILSLSIIFLLIIALIGMTIYNDCKAGWSDYKTLKYIFAFLLLVSGISSSIPIRNYIIQSNKQVIKSNNDLYRKLEELEKTNLLEKYQDFCYLESKVKYLDKINKLLSLNSIKNLVFTHENIDLLMNDIKLLKDKYGIKDIDLLVELRVYYNEYTSAISYDYEKLYQKYKSKELIKRHNLPILSVIIPLLLTIISLFISIFPFVYKDVDSNKTLFEFLLYYFIFIPFGMLITCWPSSFNFDSAIKRNNNIVLNIDRFRETI